MIIEVNYASFQYSSTLIICVTLFWIFDYFLPVSPKLIGPYIFFVLPLKLKGMRDNRSKRPALGVTGIMGWTFLSPSMLCFQTIPLAYLFYAITIRFRRALNNYCCGSAYFSCNFVGRKNFFCLTNSCCQW